MGKVSYFEACKRHYADGELLMKHHRWPNAGQLYGVSAECGIKALLIGLGYPTDLDGGILKKNKNYRKHVDALCTTIFFQLIVEANNRGGSKYLAMIPKFPGFSDWMVDHRYFSERQIPASLDKWLEAAKEIQLMIDQAVIDGVIK